MIDLQVKVSGPIFTGQAQAAVDAYIDAAEDAVATEGVNEVQRILGSVLRNPTGFYESRIQTGRQREDMAVTDGGVIYGAWLESGAYTPPTRFRGYGHFRQATQRLQARADRIAQSVIGPFIDRMNR